ncbi:MAG: uracil-DNA glycosylase family protein [Patescibacteria group bacterium]|jgi:uracil-DNA glycosylase family 4
MNKEIHNCLNIQSKPLSFFFQKGSSTLGKKVLILGESLARNGWLESGRAFYSLQNKIVPTGKRLNEELLLIHMTLEECAFTEIAKCYISSNRKRLVECGSLCARHLLEQIHHNKPKVILSLGVVTKDILESTFQTKLQMGKASEVVYKTKKYLLLPLFHPSPANPFGHAKNITIINRNKNTLKKLIGE